MIAAADNSAAVASVIVAIAVVVTAVAVIMTVTGRPVAVASDLLEIARAKLRGMVNGMRRVTAPRATRIVTARGRAMASAVRDRKVKPHVSSARVAKRLRRHRWQGRRKTWLPWMAANQPLPQCRQHRVDLKVRRAHRVSRDARAVAADVVVADVAVGAKVPAWAMAWMTPRAEPRKISTCSRQKAGLRVAMAIRSRSRMRNIVSPRRLRSLPRLRRRLKHGPAWCGPPRPQRRTPPHRRAASAKSRPSALRGPQAAQHAADTVLGQIQHGVESGGITVVRVRH